LSLSLSSLYRPRRSMLYPYTTLFRSQWEERMRESIARAWPQWSDRWEFRGVEAAEFTAEILPELEKLEDLEVEVVGTRPNYTRLDRKSTRLNSSHVSISYAVFCLNKK